MTIRDASGYRWYIVWLLLLVFILSYLDRYILTLIIEPIKASMGLNECHVGLLLGPAFSLFHVLVGIPLGWYADRANPQYLPIGVIIIWCAITLGSGFEHPFPLLFILLSGSGPETRE